MTRPTYSIHTHAFNVVRMGFDWKGALENWLSFLAGSGQLVVAVNTSDDDTVAVLREWANEWKLTHTGATRIDIIDIAIPYTDADFDGRGKAAALAACTEPFAILLDLDEVIPPQMRRKWDRLALELEAQPTLEGVLIPSVDLIGDEGRYRCGGDSLSAKWYLHKRLPHITRGVWRGARRDDGSIDKTKSDTCEALDSRTGDLIRAVPIMAPLPHWMAIAQMEGGEVPFVYHLASLNLEQRAKQSAFWRPHWDNRDQHSVEPETTLETLGKVPRYRHDLPSWRETR